MFKCGAQMPLESGEVVECDHLTEIEGRYCSCCEFIGGLLTPKEALDRVNMLEQIFLSSIFGQMTNEQGIIVIHHHDHDDN